MTFPRFADKHGNTLILEVDVRRGEQLVERRVATLGREKMRGGK